MTDEQILDYLFDLAEEENLEVLYAKSFGSRAWNVDDDESDYDVAVVFRQPVSSYITLGEYTQNIQETATLEESGSKPVEVNVHGWNVDRYMQLLSNSNPTALEVLSSDKTYVNHGEFEDLVDYAQKNFRPIAMMGHYHSLMKQNYLKYLQKNLIGPNDKRYKVRNESRDTYEIGSSKGSFSRVMKADAQGSSGDFDVGTLERTVKRNLYVARAICYKRYIEETHSMPSLDLTEFLREEEEFLKSLYDGELYNVVSTLVRRKREGEGGEEAGNLVEDIAESEIERDIQDKELHNVRGISDDVLNKVIRRIIADNKKLEK